MNTFSCSAYFLSCNLTLYFSLHLSLFLSFCLSVQMVKVSIMEFWVMAKRVLVSEWSVLFFFFFFLLSLWSGKLFFCQSFECKTAGFSREVFRPLLSFWYFFFSTCCLFLLETCFKVCSLAYLIGSMECTHKHSDNFLPKQTENLLDTVF